MGALRHPLVVRHHDDGRAALLIEVQQNVHYLVAHHRIEIPRRFVGQDDLRVADDGACDGDALPLPARELGGVVGHPIF